MNSDAVELRRTDLTLLGCVLYVASTPGLDILLQLGEDLLPLSPHPANAKYMFIQY
jgi:hypothetical protein